MGYFATLSINDIQHIDTKYLVPLYWVSGLLQYYAEFRYAECPYAECRHAECCYAIRLGW
jgi:hypothetical protein